MRPTRTVRFGAFTVDLHSGELYKQGRKIKLQQKPFQILAVLLDRPGEVVTREELRRQIWPPDTFVDFDHGLNSAIRPGDPRDGRHRIRWIRNRWYGGRRAEARDVRADRARR